MLSTLQGAIVVLDRLQNINFKARPTTSNAEVQARIRDMGSIATHGMNQITAPTGISNPISALIKLDPTWLQGKINSRFLPHDAGSRQVLPNRCLQDWHAVMLAFNIVALRILHMKIRPSSTLIFSLVTYSASQITTTEPIKTRSHPYLPNWGFYDDYDFDDEKIKSSGFTHIR